MTDETNRKVVEDYMTAWSNADRGKLDRLLADGFRFTNPPPGITPDKTGAIQMAQQYRAGFPDLKIRFDNWVVQGNNVAVRFHGSGTHRGSFMGVEPSNVKTETGGIAIVTLKDGKVIEDTTEYDALGLMTQIGAIPPIGEGSEVPEFEGPNRPTRPGRGNLEEERRVGGYRQN